ncbi:hypothetical protein, partial [Pricia sp.]|uniref:hypothetical protein n=1 Tax=Pricia sp. TaxID=2268138 RepID=UPI00359444BE
MNKGILFLVWCHIAFFGIVHGQTIENENLSVYDEIPKENLFVHYNSSVLFSGETLYYKIYCLNAKTANLSSLSKIAYIELV